MQELVSISASKERSVTGLEDIYKNKEEHSLLPHHRLWGNNAVYVFGVVQSDGMIEGHCGILYMLVLLKFVTVVDVNSCSVTILLAISRLN